MNTYSISALLGVTTMIAVAFSLGRLLGPAPTLTAFVALYCVGPICCRIIVSLAGRHIQISLNTLLCSVLAVGLFASYTFAGIETTLPVVFFTMLLWVPQLLVMRFLASCRSGRLWYLYWGYKPPLDTPASHDGG